jgi:DNA-binding NarL/FixJ family response regulator
MMGKMKTTRVLIVDDHELLRDGLKGLLNSQEGLEVCGEASDEEMGFRQIRKLQPDLVIVDITLNKGNGIELIKRIHQHYPSVLIIVASMHDEKVYGERVLRAGAMGYVSKQDPSRTILRAIRQVLDDKVYFSEVLTRQLLARAADAGFKRSPIEMLSDRELEVFTLIGQGMTTGQVAEKLHLSPRTIETYRQRLKAKLNVDSGGKLNREAVQWVLENR